MAADVISALVVTLGLDAAKFKSGQEEVTKSFKETTASVKEGAVSMTSSIARVAAEFIGLFLAVRGVGDIIHLFEDLNGSLRRLGFDSRNFGIAAGELRDWQEVAELAGGKAEDATQAIGSLQQSIFNLRFKGEVSDQIIGLQRLGISALTTAGQMRPFKDVLLDVARAMERNHWDDATKYQYVTGYLGFSGGIANALVQGTKAVEGYLSAAEKAEQVTRRNTDAAQALGVSWVNLKYSVAGAAAQILTNLTPTIKGLFEQLGKITPQMLNEFATWVKGPGAESIKEFFTDLATVIGGVATAIRDIAGVLNFLEANQGGGLTKKFFDWISNSAETTRGIRNNNPLNLKATGNQARDAGGFAVFGSIGEGYSAAFRELDRYRGRGLNTIRGIVSTWAPPGQNDTAAYVQSVSRALGKSPDMPLSFDDYQALVNAMARVESGSGVPVLPQSLPAHPGALGAAQGAGAASGALGPPISANRPAGAGVSVDIGSMTVNTQADDAGAIARDIAAAVQRKFNVFQADTGVYA